ncbi:unnamed protein product [Moneuplotes crassus]|uniref:Uncharacterized protein n=2 Tax=Euplotes crassus TaxID=5936 RepID=A0AAD1Y073_EUPCR|nr:unnamed protein product [Moneuplotes crassus]
MKFIYHLYSTPRKVYIPSFRELLTGKIRCNKTIQKQAQRKTELQERILVSITPVKNPNPVAMMVVEKYKNIKKREKQPMTVERGAKSLSKFLGIYRTGMASMLQGYREVTTDENFKFDDGTTVKERMDRFESRMKRSKGTYSDLYFNL